MNTKSKIRAVKSEKVEKIKCPGFIPSNLLERHFDATLPNLKWVTDMSDPVVNHVKFYFSAILDLYNREIIAFVISDSPNLILFEDTLNAAIEARGLADLKNIIIHSDQGSVYRSFNHHQLSKKLGFVSSMSRKANCRYNAVVERFFSHLKTEFPHLFPVDSAEQVMGDLPVHQLL
ncbi:DDE-type integrase/transposase/recombinase [Sporosarcina psychrophila]|uniref:DDE-type integrase/transposase/recombinase n=1 Tax=Sporosarcina psychrophila TaxID=1476 RepID=UPI0018D46BE5|nr:DDE-type integrase/transposase/recombinase [Sporosarcina psychrophila]